MLIKNSRFSNFLAILSVVMNSFLCNIMQDTWSCVVGLDPTQTIHYVSVVIQLCLMTVV